MRPSHDSEATHPVSRVEDPIPGYRLIRKRGRGGAAEVWEAEAPGGFRVALKIVNLSTDRTSGELRSLEIIRGIHHPNLLAIFGAWQVDKRLIIGMELADRSLWDRFLEARSQGLCGIPRRELLDYLQAAAVTVDFLNDYRHTVEGRQRIGIQHRDLKPQNILLFGGCAKVADFGLARVMERSVASHTGTCTLAYAAPEFFGKKTSRQSDQYALAVTYCQLRGGRMPFLGTTAQIAVGHLLNEPDLESLPEPERAVVARALSKRPKDRWPGCRSFIDALKSLGSAEGDPLPDALPRQEPDDQPGQGHATLPCAPFDPALLMAHSDFIPMDTGDSNFPLDLAEDGFDTVFLPREGRDVHPGQNNKAAPFLSPPSVAAAQSDFVPLDTGDSDFPLDVFESASALAGYRTARVRLGTAFPVGSSSLDRAQEGRLAPPGRSGGEGPDRHETERRVAVSAEGRTGRARVGLYSALVALGFGVLIWVARDHAGRPLRAAPRTDRNTARAASDRLLTDQAGVPQRAAVGTAPNPVHTSMPPRGEPPARLRASDPAPAVSSPSITEPRRAKPKTETVADLPSGEEEAAARVAARVSKREAAQLPGPDRVSPGTSSPVSETFPPQVASGATAGIASAFEYVAMSLSNTAQAPAAVPTRETDPPPRPVKAESEVAADTAPEGRDDNGPGSDPGGLNAPVVMKPGIDVPARVSVRAGETAKVHVRVRGVKASGPVNLDFRGLPPGVSVPSPSLPTGEDQADVILVASTEAPTGVVVASVAFEVGAARAESGLKLEVQPSPAKVAYQRGRSEFTRHAYDRAVEAFTEAIRLDPDSFLAHRDRGVAYHLQGRYREALADYSEAIRLSPDDALTYLVRARVHRELGENDRALNDYTEAIRLRPDVNAFLARGLVHHDLGNYDRALADFSSALELQPGNLNALFHRGLTRYHSGDHNGAIADLTEVIRLDPKYAAAYRYRGDIFARMGQSARAGDDHDAFQRLVIARDPARDGRSPRDPGRDRSPRENRPSSTPSVSSPRSSPAVPRLGPGGDPGLPPRPGKPVREIRASVDGSGAIPPEDLDPS
jgi:serine/threonine protein kinase/lipoprotein NlpI